MNENFVKNKLFAHLKSEKTQLKGSKYWNQGRKGWCWSATLQP
jgi:hypothetical protein